MGYSRGKNYARYSLTSTIIDNASYGEMSGGDGNTGEMTAYDRQGSMCKTLSFRIYNAAAATALVGLKLLGKVDRLDDGWTELLVDDDWASISIPIKSFATSGLKTLAAVSGGSARVDITGFGILKFQVKGAAALSEVNIVAHLVN